MNWWRVVRLVSTGSAALGVLLGASWAVTAGRNGPAVGEDLTPAETQAVVQAAAVATVGVRAVTCGVTVEGSGFVTDGRLVTSRHLVAGADAMEVRMVGAGAVPVLVRAPAATGPDLALGAPVGGLILPAGLPLAPADPVVDQPVVAASRIDGQVRWLQARVQTLTDGPAYGDRPVVLLDQPVGRGWSGGPVLDRQGRVVAVVRAVDNATGLTLAVPVSQVQEWLKIGTVVDAGTPCLE